MVTPMCARCVWNRDAVIDKNGIGIKDETQMRARDFGYHKRPLPPCHRRRRITCVSYFYGWSLAKAPNLRQALLDLDFTRAAKG